MTLPSLWLRAASLGALAVIAGCQSGPTPPLAAAEVGEIRAGSGYLRGYLARQDLPNSLALLPQPPQEGQGDAAADRHHYQVTRALRDSPRWHLAAQDANLKFPGAADAFSCALGLPITETETPHLTMLMRRTLADAGLATYAAKDHYKRPRPFVVFQETSCTPAEEPSLRNDGAYPSGHAALGWAWGLVLSELAPERTDALVQRGRAFGDSRALCGVHWKSDVETGRWVGAAAVARLHANETFLAQMKAAKAEIAGARTRGAKPNRDCKAEAAALAQ